VSIRLRTVDGVRVALCAVESDPMPGDIYLDDGDHYALSMKFMQDWQEEMRYFPTDPPREWAVMETQKVRDAKEEMDKWQEELREKASIEELDEMIAYWEREKEQSSIEKISQDRIVYAQRQIDELKKLRSIKLERL
jgi:hypothetical protein